MHGLGRICFQKVVHQPIQQHGPSLFEENGKNNYNQLVLKRQTGRQTKSGEFHQRGAMLTDHHSSNIW